MILRQMQYPNEDYGWSMKSLL